jgi:hypothetical protein
VKTTNKKARQQQKDISTFIKLVQKGVVQIKLIYELVSKAATNRPTDQ